MHFRWNPKWNALRKLSGWGAERSVYSPDYRNTSLSVPKAHSATKSPSLPLDSNLNIQTRCFIVSFWTVSDLSNLPLLLCTKNSILSILDNAEESLVCDWQIHKLHQGFSLEILQRETPSWHVLRHTGGLTVIRWLLIKQVDVRMRGSWGHTLYWGRRSPPDAQWFEDPELPGRPRAIPALRALPSVRGGAFTTDEWSNRRSRVCAGCSGLPCSRPSPRCHLSTSHWIHLQAGTTSSVVKINNSKS